MTPLVTPFLTAETRLRLTRTLENSPKRTIRYTSPLLARDDVYARVDPPVRVLPGEPRRS